MTRSDARLSTYSGAPSLQPSLAPTLETTSNRSSSQQYSSRLSEQTSFPPRTVLEQQRTSGTCTASSATTANKASTMSSGSRAMYANGDAAKGGSSWTLSSNDPHTADIRSFANVLDKMADARLDKQRYVMSGNKTEEVSKIALGAKVERALSRRMVGQDAILRPASVQAKKSLPSPIDEKRALEVQAA